MGDFSVLDPHTVIESSEAALGRALTGFSLSLPSYINRVFELEDEDGVRLVAKYYRPGRWTVEAINDEHRFVLECSEAEIPVVPPMRLSNGKTLFLHNDISFALFPKRAGRDFDSDDPDAYLRLGRLLGRLHAVSQRCRADNRLFLVPLTTEIYVNELLEGDHVSPDRRKDFEKVCTEILAESTSLFLGKKVIRCHGDCHRGNILDRPGEGLLLIDFDDMANGPPVQDMWMLLPGRYKDSRMELEMLLEGYTEFLPFDRTECGLIEPLRAMRMIYYLAWCARQKNDYSFSVDHPGWGADSFWHDEVRDLKNQLDEIRDAADCSPNI